MAAVELFRNRGTKTTRQIAEELGVSPQLLYNWDERLKNGESLERRPPGPPPKDKVELERARNRANIVVAKAAARLTADPRQINLDIPGIEAAPPQSDLAMKYALLVQENAMLKRMLQAVMGPSN